MHTKFLIPVLLLLSAPVAAQEVGVKPFSEVGRTTVSDFWSAVKGGETGRPSSSGVTQNYLIQTQSPACADNKPCSEKAVGFWMPVHSTMSAPLVSVGTGPETGALAVLGFFAALGLLIVARLLFRLGKADPADHHHPALDHAVGHGD